MKKIIALAVAGAFAVPAFATEVSVGGHVEYIYKVTDGADDKIESGETELNIGATEELSNGYTISASINIVDDLETDVDTNADGTAASDNNGTDYTTGKLDVQGTSLTIAGPIGSISVGDVSSALDNTGDWTDVASSGGGFGPDGNDHAVLYELPALAPGLEIALSMSPANTGNNMGSGTGIKDDASAVSVTYSVAGVSLYAGNESNGDTAEIDAYGIKGTVQGVYFAYESADETKTDGTEHSVTGMAITYGLGDVKIGYESQEDKKDADATYAKKETVLFAEYSWGSNVDIYVSAVDVDESEITDGADSTRFGVEYSF